MAKRKPTVEAGGYGRYLKGGGINMGPAAWIAVSIIVGVGLGVLFLLILLPASPSIGLMIGILLPILMIGFPIIVKERRDTIIEESVPDVFEELATSLRAGATIEQALLDLTKLQKGPLINELKIAINDMEGGYSFEESIENLIGRVDVVLAKRIFKIVIDGKKAGGELADILDAVASDSRAMSRLQRERRSKTLLYVIFIFAAGAVVAPLIFGFVTQIAEVVVNVGATVAQENPLEWPGTNINIFWLYLVIESLISGMMLAAVKGVRVWKGIVFYSLSMILTATIVFEVSKIIASAMLPATL